MANPKIQVDITADASKLKKGAKDAEKALKDIDDAADKVDGKKLGKLGDIAGDVAKDKLGPLGEVADTVGVDLDAMGAKTMVAGAAVVGLGSILANGVRQLGQMTEEVRKFNNVSGAGFEESSRFVAVMDDLGVSADVGAGAVGRLAKNVEAGKLEEFGIEAVIAKDGTVDLAATLGVVADAMNATADPTERAALGTALFGRSWADLAPFLQLGSAGIRNAMDDVADYQIVTEETAQEQRNLSLAVDNMQDAFNGLSMSLAKDAIPQLTGVANGLAAVLNGAEKLGRGAGLLEGVQRIFGFGFAAERQRQLSKELDKTAEATGGLTQELAETEHQAGEASEKLGAIEQAASAMRAATPLAAELRRETAELATAAERAAAASAEQKKQLDLLNGTVTTVAQASLAYENAQARVATAAQTYAERQQEVTDKIKEFGEGTPQAIKAQQDLEQSARDYSAAAYDAAGAAVTQAEKQAELTGRTLTADEKTRIYLEALQGISTTTNDPTLKAGLDSLIEKTQAAATAADRAQAAYYAMEAAAARAAAVAAGAANIVPGVGAVPTAAAREGYDGKADGGPVTAGQTYMVGEEGPELFTPQRSGQIIPNDKLGGGGVTIVVNSPIGRPDDVVRWMREELRRLDRSAR